MLKIVRVCTLFILGASVGGVGRGQEVPTLADRLLYLRSGQAQVTSRSGKERTLVRQSESETLSPVRLAAGDTVETEDGSFCDLQIPRTGSVRISAQSAVKVPEEDESGEMRAISQLELLKGKLFIDVDGEKLRTDKRQFRLKTPAAVLAVRGTRFFAEAPEEGFETVGVHEGTVSVFEFESKAAGTLNRGQAVAVKPGAISRVRRLTPEENKESEFYSKEAFEILAAEDPERKLEVNYEVAQRPKEWGEGKFDESFISHQEGAGIYAGKSVKLSIPYRQYNGPDADSTNMINAMASIRIKLPRIEGKPTGVAFSYRSRGLKKFSVYGAVNSTLCIPSENYNWGLDLILASDNPPVACAAIPKESTSEEWNFHYVPLTSFDNEDKASWSVGRPYQAEAGELIFLIRPDVNIDKSVGNLIFELSPVLIVTDG